MGRKERKRHESREEVFRLIESGRSLTLEDIAYIKAEFSGIGGLASSGWSRGQFFTPQPVVRFVHGLFDIGSNPGRVLEPSCGAGAFLEGLLEDLCTGIEACHRTAGVARACYPGASIIAERAEVVFPYDGTTGLDGSFDYVIGNPPFGLKMEWPDVEAGKVRKLSSEEVFLLIGYRALRAGGCMAMVVPDSVLNRDSTQSLRKWLLDRCFIRAVVSLPGAAFFHAGTGVKTSVLFLQKFREGFTIEGLDYDVFMAVCDDIGWDGRGRPTSRCDLPEILKEWKRFEAGWEWRRKGDTGKLVPASPEIYAPTKYGKGRQMALFSGLEEA